MDQSAHVDWDKGLPPDVLGLIAKAGVCMEETKAVRQVSKSWEAGFGLGVTAITVHFKGPLITQCSGSLAKAAERFPGVTSLDLGESSAGDADLEGLQHFKKLKCLVLGWRVPDWGKQVLGSLATVLTDAGMRHLEGLELTRLSLCGCKMISDAGLECLKVTNV